MCGGFNVNISRATEAYIRNNGSVHDEIKLSIIGKKGQDYFGRRPQYEIDKMYQGIFENIGFKYKIGKFNAIYNRAKELAQSDDDKVCVRDFQFALSEMH